MSPPDIILKLSNIESYYGPIMASGASARSAARPDRHPARANGAGKTTVLKTVFRHPRSAEGVDRIPGKPIQRMEATRSCGWA